jgi:FkbM family methyltransferase
MVVELLLRLPKNMILDNFIGWLLTYIKESPIRTRYGFYLYFKRTGVFATDLRKAVVLGRYESLYLTILRRLIKSGDYVIDVGAHEGYVSLLMSRVVGQHGRVFAIEPNKENVSYLRKNIDLNQLKNVVVINKAISDERCNIPFYYNKDEGAWGGVIHFSYFQTKEMAMIEADTLDNLSSAYNVTNKIALCKLDIEGNELKALLGAERIISDSKPHIAFEVSLTFWAYLSNSIDVLFEFLQSKGYELFIIRNNKLQPYKWLDSRVTNMIAIHKLRKEELFESGILNVDEIKEEKK